MCEPWLPNPVCLDSEEVAGAHTREWRQHKRAYVYFHLWEVVPLPKRKSWVTNTTPLIIVALSCHTTFSPLTTTFTTWVLCQKGDFTTGYFPSARSEMHKKFNHLLSSRSHKSCSYDFLARRRSDPSPAGIALCRVKKRGKRSWWWEQGRQGQREREADIAGGA